MCYGVSGLAVQEEVGHLCTGYGIRYCYSLLMALDLRPIKDESSGLDGLYWAVDYPWPMSDRDVSNFILAREHVHVHVHPIFGND